MESLPNPVVMPELSNWSASKAWQVLTKKKPQNFNKTAAFSHHCLLRQAPSAIIGALVYWGILSDLRSMPEQSPTFLVLCSPVDYRQSIESPIGVPTFNSTEKSLTFTENTAKKGVLFDES